jgi:hypothetical protein
MFEFCNQLYNNVVKLATNVAMYSIDIYSYIEFWIRKAYFNMNTNGSMSKLCEDTNVVCFIDHDDTIKSYKNVLEYMSPVEFLNLLEKFVNNDDSSPYKLIFIENYINNEHCRILCSSAMISKQDIDFILSPNIFNDYNVESPFMNININSLESDEKLENVNLKSPINYIFKHNELLSSEFIKYFINNESINECDYEIEILDNNCNFTNVTQDQCVVLGDDDFFVLQK